MYDLQDWAAVQRVYKQTRSKRATAKILGMSRNKHRCINGQFIRARLMVSKNRSSNGDANRFFSMEHGFLEN